MQTIKKFLVLTCATWGMQASIAHADQATNTIYAEKGQLMIHLGNVPAKYQKIQVPIWSDQNGQDDLIWYPVERSDTGFNLEVPLINHSDQAGLYHVHVYGVEANEQLTGLYPLTTSVQQKDLASSCSEAFESTAAVKSFWLNTVGIRLVISSSAEGSDAPDPGEAFFYSY